MSRDNGTKPCLEDAPAALAAALELLELLEEDVVPLLAGAVIRHGSSKPRWTGRMGVDGTTDAAALGRS